MKLSILIGISEYSDAKNNLPGCKKDVQIVKELLSKTNNYDELLVLDQKMSSAKLKEKFSSFISKHKTEKIEEFLFYYTGHGEFQNDEFYYLLSDYSPNKKKQTSLQNQEVDTLIKTLKPELVVKIIDACQSGKNYIKEHGAIDKYFQETSNRYKKCYFLNSSMSDQSSYQDETVSDFTFSFINAVKQHNSKEIRYKDIMDFISDEFENNSLQTPLFVVQADFTEKFCLINPALKEFLQNLDIRESITDIQKSDLSIIEKIKEEAKNYSSKEEAFDVLNEIKQKFESLTLTDKLDELYDLEVHFEEDYSSIFKKNVIGQWLDENDHDYFAESSYKSVRKDRHINSGIWTLQSNLFGTNVNPDDYESIRDGFTVDIELPYKTIILDLISKLPNIDSFSCRLVYFVSKKQIVFFYFITNYEEVNWEEIKINNEINWLYSEFKIKDKEEIFKGIDKVFSKLENKTEEYLEENFTTK